MKGKRKYLIFGAALCVVLAIFLAEWAETRLWRSISEDFREVDRVEIRLRDGAERTLEGEALEDYLADFLPEGSARVRPGWRLRMGRALGTVRFYMGETRLCRASLYQIPTGSDLYRELSGYVSQSGYVLRVAGGLMHYNGRAPEPY